MKPELKHFLAVLVLIGLLIGAYAVKDDKLFEGLLLAAGGINGVVNLLMNPPTQDK